MGKKYEYFLDLAESKLGTGIKRTGLEDIAYKLFTKDVRDADLKYYQNVMSDSYDVAKYSDYLLDFENKLPSNIHSIILWEDENLEVYQ